jgi:trigger factor
LNTNVIEKSKWERDLEVEVPAERIDQEMTSAMRRYQRRLEIPGFRKGKVPLKVIERRFGPSIRSGVIQDLLPTLIHEASEQTGLVPAGSPRITALDQVEDGGLTFTASIDIWPEVELQGEDALELERLEHEVTDVEINEQIEEMRTRNASEQTVERPLATGDVLIADLQRLDEEGNPVEGEKYEERYFHIGADDAPSPDFEEALIGIEAGQDRKINFSYRSDLPNEELAGKQEHFAVTAREVRERVLPEVDDEFAKDMGPQFESLQALKDHIRSQMEERWRYMSRQKVRSDVMDSLLKANEIELPNRLVENYAASVRREREKQQGHHDHDHDHDHDHHDEMSDEEREAAERRLKTYLIMESLRKKVGVEVSDEEFEQYLATRAEQSGMKLEELKRSPRAVEMRRDLEEDKIFEHLEKGAKITHKTI